MQIPQNFRAPDPLPVPQAESFADLKWWDAGGRTRCGASSASWAAREGKRSSRPRTTWANAYKRSGNNFRQLFVQTPPRLRQGRRSCFQARTSDVTGPVTSLERVVPRAAYLDSAQIANSPVQDSLVQENAIERRGRAKTIARRLFPKSFLGLNVFRPDQGRERRFSLYMP